MRNLQAEIIAFRDARDWGRFHTGPDVAAAIAVEAGELLDLFLFGREPHDEDVAAELADVLIFALTLAHDRGIDLDTAVRAKLVKNARRYPVATARGSNAKAAP